MPHPEQPSYEELAARNAELAARVSELLAVVAEQAALIETLRTEVAALRRQAGRDYLLTELMDVSAAQAGRPSQQPITEVSGTSKSPGCRSPAASPITRETGHTGLNRSAIFSSLPIFDVSRSRP
jgi:uncharacterized coiled-coil protein SlyX